MPEKSPDIDARFSAYLSQIGNSGGVGVEGAFTHGVRDEPGDGVGKVGAVGERHTLHAGERGDGHRVADDCLRTLLQGARDEWTQFDRIRRRRWHRLWEHPPPWMIVAPVDLLGAYANTVSLHGPTQSCIILPSYERLDGHPSRHTGYLIGTDRPKVHYRVTG